MTIQEVDVHMKQEQESKLLHRGLAEILFASKKPWIKKIKIPPKTMSRIIIEDLGFGPYQKSTGQRLTDVLR